MRAAGISVIFHGKEKKNMEKSWDNMKIELKMGENARKTE